MSEHTIFFFPYGDFRNKQLPLLKAAALYFDKLYILDPFTAVSGGEEFSRGSTPQTRNDIANDIRLLKREGILEPISPEAVLAKFGDQIEAAIRDDLQDPEFIRLCDTAGKSKSWLISLAKVPKQDKLDRALQYLVGGLPNDLIPFLEPYYQDYSDKKRYEEITPEPYIEHSLFQVDGERTDYRYREFSLPLGESIMVNHALFGGLLHTGATPLTDEKFHRDILALKLKRARTIPEVQEILEDRIKERKLKRELLAANFLRDDIKLDLPLISPELPLDAILEYRYRQTDHLQAAKTTLDKVARRIREEPWSDDFEKGLEHKVIPDLMDQLSALKKARDSWLKSRAGTQILGQAGIAATAAVTSATLALNPIPLLSVQAMGLILGAVGASLPFLGSMQQWREGKETVSENGLHYFLDLTSA